MSNIIDMETVIKMLLPGGPIWEPEEEVLISLGATELITNGEFDAGVGNWTDASDEGLMSWNSGAMNIRTNSAP